jgi:lycopene cyclase domain-containing protein
MSPYTTYNLLLAFGVLAASTWLTGGRLRDLRVSSRIAVLMVVIAYPWDFFAIHFNVWTYPVVPGLTLYGVPVNDSIFIWLCTFLASSLLIAVYRRQSASRSHSKSKYACDQNASKDRYGPS